MTLETQTARQCGGRVCRGYSGSCTNSIGSKTARAENTANGTEALSLSAKPTASLTSETMPATEAVLPAPTPPIPSAPVSEPIPLQSKESSLTHRLQTPDKEATVSFTVDMSVWRAP
ncbi:hypothetical protein QT995_16890 [Microcoleus sp. S36b_A3]|uniref:hypothetical protein n=1 Tax=unclassified Microcoleus TaxID=2642155 RepID=UPI002FD68799